MAVKVKISKNIKETKKIAQVFLEEIFKKDPKSDKALVICLSGNLGAGKTFFTQAVALHLGVKEKIKSPTFVIMKKYQLKKGNYKFLFHFDAYRLKDEKELLHLGWSEIVKNKEHLIFIEWPENVRKVIPKGSRHIFIESKKNEHRKLELK